MALSHLPATSPRLLVSAEKLRAHSQPGCDTAATTGDSVLGSPSRVPGVTESLQGHSGASPWHPQGLALGGFEHHRLASP